jgi:hypothetical protein
VNLPRPSVMDTVLMTVEVQLQASAKASDARQAILMTDIRKSLNVSASMMSILPTAATFVSSLSSSSHLEEVINGF